VNETTQYTIERVSQSASSYLKRLPRKQQEIIAQAFDYLCQVSPFQHPNPTTIRPLKGEYQGLWRYRVGNIRIIYSVDETDYTLSIVAIDNRGNVY